MTPALRHNDADRKLLLLAIWKVLWWLTCRNTRSTQMTAAPRTQAVKPSQSSLADVDRGSTKLTDARDGAHHPAPEVVGSHSEGSEWMKKTETVMSVRFECEGWRSRHTFASSLNL